MSVPLLLLALLMAAMAAVFARQAARAWHDPAWEPFAGQSPRCVAALTALFVSFALILAGGSALPAARGTAAALAVAVAVTGMFGLAGSAAAVWATGRYGRPEFLVPPPYRSRPRAGAARVERPAGRPQAGATPAAALAEGPGPVPAGGPEHGPASAPGPEPGPASAAGPESGPVSATAAPGGPDLADGEFIVLAGPGSHLTGAGADSGRLILTSRRLLLGTGRPDPGGPARSWPVAGMRQAAAGPGADELTVTMRDGSAEDFAVITARDRAARAVRDRWLTHLTRLLSLPQPVTSWYGDPPDAGRPVAGPPGQAVVALWRVAGERINRRTRYRVLLDGRPVAKIRPGQRLELPVPPGRHALALRYLTAGSPLRVFEAGPGEVVRFCCEPGAFYGLTQADTQRNPIGYIRLRRLPGAAGPAAGQP